jgi:hypothetical protein
MFNEIFGIVKEEADWEYTSGVLAQEVYSLYLNNTLELNKNTMIIHCIWIQHTIDNILCTVHTILYILYSLLYIVYYALQKIYYI